MAATRRLRSRAISLGEDAAQVKSPAAVHQHQKLKKIVSPSGSDGRRKPKRKIRDFHRALYGDLNQEGVLLEEKRGGGGELDQPDRQLREKLPVKTSKKKVSVKDYLDIIHRNQSTHEEQPLDPVNVNDLPLVIFDADRLKEVDRLKELLSTAPTEVPSSTTIDLPSNRTEVHNVSSETSSNTGSQDDGTENEDSEDPDWMKSGEAEKEKPKTEEEEDNSKSEEGKSESEDNSKLEEEEEGWQDGDTLVKEDLGVTDNSEAMASRGAPSNPIVTENHCDSRSRDNNSKDQGRQLVDGNHVIQLVQDYWKHFREFSKGRKKAVVQIIPSKVWKLVYADYKAAFPTTSFSECILKEHLRKAITEMKSGVGNPDGGLTAIVQDEELMVRLMETESWKSRNILKVRDVVSTGQIPRMQFEPPQVGSGSQPRARSAPNISGAAAAAASKSDIGSGSTSGSRPASTTIPGQSPAADKAPQPAQPNARTPQSGVKPLTKSQNLKRAGDDISAVLSEFKSMKQDGVHVALDPTKKSVNEAKAAFFNSRKVESEARAKEAAARAEGQMQQNLMNKLALLDRKKTLGLISVDEYTEQCRAALDM